MFLIRLSILMFVLFDLAAACHYASKDRTAWTIVYLFGSGLGLSALQALQGLN